MVFLTQPLPTRDTIDMDEDFKAQTIKAINDLQSLGTQRLNRLLACEALLQSLIQLVDPQALAALAGEYDDHLGILAAQLAPKYQQPDRWTHFSAAIEARLQRIQQK